MQYALTWTYIHNYTLAFLPGSFGYAGAPCIYKDYRCQFLPAPLGKYYINGWLRNIGCPFDSQKDKWIQHGYVLPTTGLPEQGPYSPENDKDITALWWRMGTYIAHYITPKSPRKLLDSSKSSAL